MALLPRANSFSQRGIADVGRCGLPFDFQPLPVSPVDAAAQAGQRLLAAAAFGDGMQMLRCVADGADPNFEDPATGETALHRAAQRNQVGVLELLASLSADMDRPDRAGRTPLYVATSCGYIDAVSKLLSLGSSLFAEPKTPRSSCSDSGCGRCGGSRSTPTPAPTPGRGCACASAPAGLAHGRNATSATTDPNPSDHHHHHHHHHHNGPLDASDDVEASLLALRAVCPLASASAAGRWPLVAALLSALPTDYQTRPAALRSLRFLVWALASHRAFPPAVIAALPPQLPRCVLDAVRPAHLASTPLVLATGNDQQQLMQWLLARGADPELGAPLLLCAGRFCRGSRACCVSTLLRRGAAPHVAWADTPADSPLALAAAGDCFTHVHCLVAFGADVGGEAARVRQALYSPAPWEAHLDGLKKRAAATAAAAAGQMVTSSSSSSGADGVELMCPCGQQHARWPGLWPQDGEVEGSAPAGDEGEGEAEEGVEEGAGGNSCHNRTPADDAWYRRHRAQMEQLQDGKELAECRKAVDELWRYGCSAVVSELGGPPSAPHSLLPARVLEALQDLRCGWLAAAARCRQQRQLRAELYDKAVAAGRALLDRKRVAALAALSGLGGRDGAAAPGDCASELASARVSGQGGGYEEEGRQPQLQLQQQHRSQGGLVRELRMEILALAGLAPQGVEPWALSRLPRAACGCPCCRGGR